MAKKRNDLSGCVVSVPTGAYTYDVTVRDENGTLLVGVHIPDRANTSKAFTRLIADAIKAAIPKANEKVKADAPVGV